MYQGHELVVLTRDVPTEGLNTGDVGTVVGRYGNGGYEVEFATADGHTLAVVTLGESDIRLRASSEILHVRGVAQHAS